MPHQIYIIKRMNVCRGLVAVGESKAQYFFINITNITSRGSSTNSNGMCDVEGRRSGQCSV